MRDKYASGWERGRELRQWRAKKGGSKPHPKLYLNTRLGQLMGEWLEDQEERGLSPATLRTRRTLVHRFLQWCWGKAVTEPAWLSTGLMREWCDWLDNYRTKRHRHYTEYSREAMLRTVKGYLTFLLERGLLKYDPLDGVCIRRRPGRPLPNMLDEAQVAAVCAAPDTADLLGLRDRAILELFYSSALRRSELLALAMPDLRLDDCILVVRHAKGDKERIVPIGRAALHWLGRYLTEARPQLLIPGEPCDAVFLTCYGGAFSHGALGELVRRYLDVAGIQMTGACHLLRHACATHLLDHGADLRTIQTILGHARVDTTEIYTHVSNKRVRQVHRDCHPRG